MEYHFAAKSPARPRRAIVPTGCQSNSQQAAPGSADRGPRTGARCGYRNRQDRCGYRTDPWTGQSSARGDPTGHDPRARTHRTAPTAPPAVFPSDQSSHPFAELNHDDALRSSTSFSTKYALHVELDRKPDRIQLCGERQLCPVVSTGRRNTLIFLERWSVYHEVSATNVLYRCAKVGDVGSLSAMHASPAGSGWQRGESLSSIGRGFNRASSSIYPLLARTGGIRPAERVRSRLSLTLIEREEISRGLL